MPEGQLFVQGESRRNSRPALFVCIGVPHLGADPESRPLLMPGLRVPLSTGLVGMVGTTQFPDPRLNKLPGSRPTSSDAVRRDRAPSAGATRPGSSLGGSSDGETPCCSRASLTRLRAAQGLGSRDALALLPLRILAAGPKAAKSGAAAGDKGAGSVTSAAGADALQGRELLESNPVQRGDDSARLSGAG